MAIVFLIGILGQPFELFNGLPLSLYLFVCGSWFELAESKGPFVLANRPNVTCLCSVQNFKQDEKVQVVAYSQISVSNVEKENDSPILLLIMGRSNINNRYLVHLNLPLRAFTELEWVSHLNHDSLDRREENREHLASGTFINEIHILSGTRVSVVSNPSPEHQTGSRGLSTPFPHFGLYYPLAPPPPHKTNHQTGDNEYTQKTQGTLDSHTIPDVISLRSRQVAHQSALDA